MKTTLQIASLAVLISLLGGCATSVSKDTLLPKTGPTMEEVYREHVTQNDQASPMRETSLQRNWRRPVSSGSEDLADYTRDANNEIQSIFPTLKNPTLVMYVFPHLSTESRLPVPGYSTSFSMYEKTEYALPGEQ